MLLSLALFFTFLANKISEEPQQKKWKSDDFQWTQQPDNSRVPRQYAVKEDETSHSTDYRIISGNQGAIQNAASKVSVDAHDIAFTEIPKIKNNEKDIYALMKIAAQRNLEREARMNERTNRNQSSAVFYEGLGRLSAIRLSVILIAMFGPLPSIKIEYCLAMGRKFCLGLG